jgi:FMN phosphatase YigB (HAD superfamily)
MIKAVLFDYGGVLSPNGRADAFIKMVGKSLGLPSEKVDSWNTLREFRAGLIDEATCVATIRDRYPHKPILDGAIFREKSGMLVRNELVYQLASSLREHDIRTGILSDIYLPTAEMLQTHGNYEGFDPIMLSCYTHLRKPDPEIYTLALAKLNLYSAEVLFVDDQEKMLEPARSLDMQTLLAESPEQIVTQIKHLVLEQDNIELSNLAQ